MPEMASWTSSAVWIWMRTPSAARRRTSSTPCASAASACGQMSLQGYKTLKKDHSMRCIPSSVLPVLLVHAVIHPCTGDLP